MIGLRRMRANTVRRPVRGGHCCVVFDTSAKAVQELAREGAIRSSDLRDLLKKIEPPLAITSKGIRYVRMSGGVCN